MSWKFFQKKESGFEHLPFKLQGLQGQTVYLTKSPDGAWAILTKEDEFTLGVVKFDTWGARLEARNEVLTITPAGSHQHASTDPPSGAYVLQPAKEERVEVLLLRPGDMIHSAMIPKTPVLLKWTAPEVLVNSSDAPKAEIPPFSRKPQDDAAEETEDDEEVIGQKDMTAVAPVSPRATPLPSATEVVQETPTVGRIMTEVPQKEGSSASPTSTGGPHVNVAEEGADKAMTEDVGQSGDGVDVEMTTGENLPSRRKQTAKNKNKRSNPEAGEEENQDEGEVQTTAARSSKRKKTDNVATDTAKQSTPATAKNLALKGKRNGSQQTLDQEATPTRASTTPSRSQRATQAVAGDYKGRPPRVAFSNSSIAPNKPSTFTKFLRSQGGVPVESIAEGCHILCVKEGNLVTTAKLLQSIALGIRIVTDKWLIDSSRHGRLLPLEPYIPYNPKQEEECNFSLSAVWANPQSQLLINLTILFTPALKSSYSQFTEIEAVCKAAGARKVVTRKPTAKDVANKETIVLVKDKHDAWDLVQALGVEPENLLCYSKDLLNMSILRGVLDLDSQEFKVVGEEEQEQKVPNPAKKRGRPRKSIP